MEHMVWKLKEHEKRELKTNFNKTEYTWIGSEMPNSETELQM
jgi:hypothetical protein